MSPTKLRELLMLLPVRDGTARVRGVSAAVNFELDDGRALLVSHRISNPPTRSAVCALATLLDPNDETTDEDSFKQGVVVFEIDPGSNEWFAFFVDDVAKQEKRMAEGLAPNLEAFVLLAYATGSTNGDRLATREQGMCIRSGADPSRRVLFAAPPTELRLVPN